jgi:glutamate dehydrogenase
MQDEMFLLLRRLVERSARWLVRHAQPLAMGPTVARFQPGVQTVMHSLTDLLVGRVADAVAATAARFAEAGVPLELARQVAASDAALAALPAVALGEEHELDPREVVSIQVLLDDRLGLDQLRDRIAALPRADRWQTEARAALRDDFYDSQYALTEAVITATDPAGAPEARVDEWLGARDALVDRYLGLVHDVERSDATDLAALAVLRRGLRDLAAI